MFYLKEMNGVVLLPVQATPSVTLKVFIFILYEHKNYSMYKPAKQEDQIWLRSKLGNDDFRFKM